MSSGRHVRRGGRHAAPRVPRHRYGLQDLVRDMFALFVFIEGAA